MPSLPAEAYRATLQANHAETHPLLPRTTASLAQVAVAAQYTQDGAAAGIQQGLPCRTEGPLAGCSSQLCTAGVQSGHQHAGVVEGPLCSGSNGSGTSTGGLGIIWHSSICGG